MNLSPRSETTSLYIALAMILGFSLAIKIPSLFSHHAEGDELIYLNCINNLLQNGNYSLQNTPILKNLYAPIYDRPLFHHPPLFVLLAAPLVVGFSNNHAVIISWLGHWMIIVSVFYFLMSVVIPPSKSRFGAVFVPTLAVSMDPLLVFVSHKIWFDSLLTGFMSLTLLFFFLGLKSGRQRFFWTLASMSLGLGTLVKVQLLIVTPILMVAWVLDSVCTKRWGSIRNLSYLLGPAVLISAPWFFIFFQYYGTLIPNWLVLDSEFLAQNSFLKMIAQRPWYYFFQEIWILNPLLAAIVVLVSIQIKKGDPLLLSLSFGFVFLLSTLTLIVASDHNLQMRFIAGIFPLAYLLLGVCLATMRGQSANTVHALLVILIIFNAMAGFFNVIRTDSAEVFGLLRVFYLGS